MANSVPNWQHHSRKDQKRRLKPQALRDARRRRQALKLKLGNNQPTNQPIPEGHLAPGVCYMGEFPMVRYTMVHVYYCPLGPIQ